MPAGHGPSGALVSPQCALPCLQLPSQPALVKEGLLTAVLWLCAVSARRYAPHSPQSPYGGDLSGHAMGQGMSPMSPRMPVGSPRPLPYGPYPPPQHPELMSPYASPGCARTKPTGSC